MGSDGTVQREPSDTGLDALLGGLAPPLERRLLRTRETAEGEPVSLLALGRRAALRALPD